MDDEFHEGADVEPSFRGVPQRLVEVEDVLVAPPGPSPADIAG